MSRWQFPKELGLPVVTLNKIVWVEFVTLHGANSEASGFKGLSAVSLWQLAIQLAVFSCFGNWCSRDNVYSTLFLTTEFSSLDALLASSRDSKAYSFISIVYTCISPFLPFAFQYQFSFSPFLPHTVLNLLLVEQWASSILHLSSFPSVLKISKIWTTVTQWKFSVTI